jgi:hypothetical protein
MLGQHQCAPARVQPVSPDGRVFSGSYEGARSELDDLLARLKRAVAAEGRRKVRRLVRFILASPAAHFVAVHEANAKLKPKRRHPQAVVREIAARLDPWRQSTQTVRVHLIPKDKGGVRPVADYALEARAAKLLVRKVIRPILRTRDDQFALKNGGEPAAARRVVALIENGYAYAAKLDIVKAFSSFKEQGIIEFLEGVIPRKVSQATCLARGDEFRLSNPAEHLGHTVHKAIGAAVGSVPVTSADMGLGSGLGQGAASSSLITEAAVASVIDDAERRPEWPKSVQLVIFVDDIAVFGRPRSAVETAVGILGDAFERTRVGPLKVTTSEVQLVSRGFDFLGKRFTAKRDRVTVQVTPAKRAKFLNKLISKIKLVDRDKDREHIEDLRSYVRSWGASSSLRQGGRPLTLAIQWANSIMAYALDQKLRGRALRGQAVYLHYALYDPSYVDAHR